MSKEAAVLPVASKLIRLPIHEVAVPRWLPRVAASKSLYSLNHVLVRLHTAVLALLVAAPASALGNAGPAADLESNPKRELQQFGGMSASQAQSQAQAMGGGASPVVP